MSNSLYHLPFYANLKIIRDLRVNNYNSNNKYNIYELRSFFKQDFTT